MDNVNLDIQAQSFKVACLLDAPEVIRGSLQSWTEQVTKEKHHSDRQGINFDIPVPFGVTAKFEDPETGDWLTASHIVKWHFPSETRIKHVHAQKIWYTGLKAENLHFISLDLREETAKQERLNAALITAEFINILKAENGRHTPDLPANNIISIRELLTRACIAAQGKQG